MPQYVVMYAEPWSYIILNYASYLFWKRIIACDFGIGIGPKDIVWRFSRQINSEIPFIFSTANDEI